MFEIRTPEDEYLRRPSTILNRFLKRVWNNPFADQKTLQHRKAGISLLEETLMLLDVHPTEYFAVPFGSTLWTIDQQSDHDFFIEAAVEEELVVSLERKTLIAKRLDLDHFFEVDRHLRVDNILAVLLFTPDQFIAGNKGEAIRSRERVIRGLDQPYDNNLKEFDANKCLNMLFDYFYRDWPLYESGSKKLNGIDRSRTTRFEQRLQELAIHSRSPEKYITSLKAAITKLQVPPFEVFKEVILQSDGHLNVPGLI